MSAMPAGPGRSTETPRDTATAGPARHGRLRATAAARGVPLGTILVTVAGVALTYLAGKLAYRIRDVLLMLIVAGFIALILNPLVVALQRWRIRRRGWAVAILSVWAVLVFAGLLAAFGYPLAHGADPFLAAAALLRAERRARSGLDRPPGPPFSPGGLGNPQRTQAAKPRGHPGQAGLDRRQGRGVVAGDPGDHLRLDRALLARGSQDAPGTARADAARARGVLHAGGGRDQPVGDRLRAGQPPDVADRRRGRLCHTYCPRGSVPAAMGAVGGPGRFSAHGRRCPGRYPHRPVRTRPLADRGHRHCGRVYRLPADRKSRAEPRGHEPHGQRQSTARPAVTPGRDIDRRLGRRLFRQFCRGAAFHPGRGRPPGHRPGTMAANRPPDRGPRDPASKHRRPAGSFVTASRNRPERS